MKELKLVLANSHKPNVSFDGNKLGVQEHIYMFILNIGMVFLHITQIFLSNYIGVI